MTLTYTKHERVWLKDLPQFDEKWLQEQIVKDPSILGLGELEIKGVEKIHPKAGRLDLLMYDAETERRYEVELMLGTVDESHIIRCIEYWDIERKRYPQYDHTAVLVAESITTRFLNVIGLFNSAIPMVAIQLNALKINDQLVLDFVKVLDEVVPGEDDEEDSVASETVDRAYWEQKKSKESLAAADRCVEIIKEFAPPLRLKYCKDYIGMSDGFRTQNFVIFNPKKHFVRVDVRIADHPMWRQRLEDAGLVLITGAKEGRRMKFRLTEEEANKHRQLLRELLEASYKQFQE